MGEAEKKEDRRVRRTRKLLTQALTELLQHKQINEISVKELTDLADVSRGTFYLYYRDVYDMLEKIEDSMFAALDGILSVYAGEEMMDQFVPMLTDLFTFIQDNREMCRVLLSPNGDMNFLHRLNEVIRDRSLNAWENMHIEHHVEEFDYHYSFVIFGCAGLIRAWVNRDCPETPAQMAALSDAMIRQGIHLRKASI